MQKRGCQKNISDINIYGIVEMIMFKMGIVIFSMIKLSDVAIKYFKPDFEYGNSMRIFRQWFMMQENHLLMKYRVNWVGNCKLIF